MAEKEEKAQEHKKGNIQGVREGTVAAAVCVGLITKLINRICAKLGFEQK